MVTLVAFSTVQVSVDVSPATIAAGLAVNVMMRGGPTLGGLTVTVTAQLTEAVPAAPAAVSV